MKYLLVSITGCFLCVVDGISIGGGWFLPFGCIAGVIGGGLLGWVALAATKKEGD